MSISINDIHGVILAGGRGIRMGGRDKGLVEYQGKALIEHVISTIQPQLPRLMININRNQRRYAHYGLLLCSDRWPDYQGPLAGMASSFECCEDNYLLFAPCDTPYLPDDLALRLIEALNNQKTRLAVVETPQGLQPLCCLMHRSLRSSLIQYLESGERRAQEWIRQQNPAICHYPSDKPFTNINSLGDLALEEESRKGA